jgi:hypothetical protein
MPTTASSQQSPAILYGLGCFCIPQNAVATPLSLRRSIELHSDISHPPNNIGCWRVCATAWFEPESTGQGKLEHNGWGSDVGDAAELAAAGLPAVGGIGCVESLREPASLF